MWWWWIQSALAASFVVDDAAMTSDVLPGDGVCATATGSCTLTAAVQEAESTARADTIDLMAGDLVVPYPIVVTRPLAIVGEGRDVTGITFDGLDLFEVGDTVLDLRDLAIHGGANADACIVGAGTDVFLERVDMDGCVTAGVQLTATNPGDPLGHVLLRDVVLADHAGIDVLDPPGVTSPAYVVDAVGVTFDRSDVVLDTTRPWAISDSRFDGGDGLDALGTELGSLDHVVFRRTDRALLVDGGKVEAFHVLFAEGATGAVQVVGDGELWCDTCVFWANAGEPALDVPPFAVGAVVALDRAVFLQNRTTGDGGGLRVRGGAGTVVHVRNTVFADNRADGSGGAISVDSRGASVLLEHLSVGRNVADADDRAGGSGGGIHVAASSQADPSLAWSALAENRRGVAVPVREECSGRLTRAGANLVGALDAGCVVAGGVDLKGTRANPLAPRWQNQRLANGLWGPVPRRGSPLLDAAVGSPIVGDLGRRPRPMDGDGDNVAVPDLGAVERGGARTP